MRIPTPKLPFALPVTTLIYVDVNTGEYSYDPITGNKPPIIKTIILKASLTDSGQMGDFGQQPGLNVGVTWFTGYIIEPVPLPDGVKLVGSVKADHTYSSGITQTGLFTFSETPNAFSGLLKTAGIPITGMFKNAGGN